MWSLSQGPDFKIHPKWLADVSFNALPPGNMFSSGPQPFTKAEKV